MSTTMSSPFTWPAWCLMPVLFLAMLAHLRCFQFAVITRRLLVATTFGLSSLCCAYVFVAASLLGFGFIDRNGYLDMVAPISFQLYFIVWLLPPLHWLQLAHAVHSVSKAAKLHTFDMLSDGEEPEA